MDHGKSSALAELLSESISVEEREGIYIDRHWKPVGVTEQFIEDADVYHDRYFVRLDFLALMDRCLTVSGVVRDDSQRVLDIGSGGGSSVFALCQLLPAAQLVASDISPQLLHILAKLAAKHEGLQRRITACCFDLHVSFFRENCFDLVVGAAILHHLLDPAQALRNVASALKPGGRLILVEPMEAGSLLTAIAYERALVVLQALGQENGGLAKLMRAIRWDIQSRLGVPLATPITAVLDDKWVFNDPYLKDLSRELGLSEVQIHPAQEDLSRIFEGELRSLIRVSGNEGMEIPLAVLEEVQEFDRAIGLELKRKMCPTGIIVFKK